MIDFETLSADAPAVILLCSSLGEPREGVGSRPLGPVAYAKLADALRRQGFGGPRELIGLDADAIARSLAVEESVADGYARRLARAGQLGFELDRLRSRGVWVVTVADDVYPARLRERLGNGTPPVLFASGPAELLSGGGVAIVGSRDADAAAVTFTERLATGIARGGSSVVSGGARGIDVTAMRAAFEAGGTVVGVVPEGVERRLREATTRSAVGGGHAVLVSPYHPMAAFSAGAAMGRNKLIYALADVAVVVSSSSGSGGTWTGALEALDAGWVPVLVRDGSDVPEGNRALIDRGAAPLAESSVGESVTVSSLEALATAGSRAAERSSAYGQQALFDE